MTAPVPGPEWLSQYLDDLLGTSPGKVGPNRIDNIRLRYDERPSAVLSASYAGLVYVDFQYDDNDQAVVDVSFSPWSSVERIRVYDASVQVITSPDNRSRPPASAVFEDADEEGNRHNDANREAARKFSVDLIRLMKGTR